MDPIIFSHRGIAVFASFSVLNDISKTESSAEKRNVIGSFVHV
jgi:hypothetical protein